MAPATGGGFVAARLPVAQSDRFRLASPGAEYVWAAAEAANEALHELGTSFNDAGVTMVFLEEVDPAPEGSPSLGYAGFTGDRTDAIHIVVNRVPDDALRWVVRHEVAHLAYTQRYGHDGSPPWIEGPSERFADAFAGPMPACLGSATLARAFASLMPVADRIQLEPGEAPKLVNGAITVTNAGATVIIDGTSNMFKILASGTLSHSQGAGTSGSTSHSFTTVGLPTFTSPAYIAYVTEGSSPADTAHRDLGRFYKTATGFVAQTSGGSPIQRMKYILWEAVVYSWAGSVSGDPSLALAMDNADSATHDATMRYHILKEAAI